MHIIDVVEVTCRYAVSEAPHCDHRNIDQGQEVSKMRDGVQGEFQDDGFIFSEIPKELFSWDKKFGSRSAFCLSILISSAAVD